MFIEASNELAALVRTTVAGKIQPVLKSIRLWVGKQLHLYNVFHIGVHTFLHLLTYFLDHGY